MPKFPEGGSGFSGSGLWTALLLTSLGAALGSSATAPIRSVRQESTSASSTNRGPSSVNAAPARAWEDPLGAAQQAFTSPTHKPKKWVGASPAQIPELPPPSSDEILVFGVPLSGDDSPDGEEDRMQRRVAVTSALAAEGFSPENSDELLFAELDKMFENTVATNKNFPRTGLDRFVVFERFTRSGDSKPKSCIISYFSTLRPVGDCPEGNVQLFMRLLETLHAKPVQGAFLTSKQSSVRGVLLAQYTFNLISDVREVAKLLAESHALDLNDKRSRYRTHKDRLDDQRTGYALLTAEVVNTTATGDLRILQRSFFEGQNVAGRAAPLARLATAEWLEGQAHREGAAQPWLVELVPSGPDIVLPLASPTTNRPQGLQPNLLPHRLLGPTLSTEIAFSIGAVVRRTLGSDARLGALVKEELKLRGINLDTTPSEVAVIYERDTTYARSFAHGLRKPGEILAAENTPKPAFFAASLEYDIAFPTVIDGLPISAPRTIIPERDGGYKGRAPVPLGQSQLDYVHRALAARATSQSKLFATGMAPLRAVVLIASEPADKRPIIQMIRRQFPNMLIIACDMHASLTDINDSAIMRNVIIVSHLGLSPDPTPAAGRSSIPPMRTAYQTSLFQACRDLINNAPLKPPPPPRAFEITLNGPRQLTFPAPVPWPETFSRTFAQRFTPTGAITVLLALALLCYTYIIADYFRSKLSGLAPRQPLKPGVSSALQRNIFWSKVCFAMGSAFQVSAAWVAFGFLTAFRMILLQMSVAFVAAVAGTVYFSWRHAYRNQSRDSGLDFHGRKVEVDLAERIRIFVDQALFVVSLLWLATILFFVTITLNSGDRGEPWGLFDGASSWISEIIRVGVIAFAVYFAFRILTSVRELVKPSRAVPVPSSGSRARSLRRRVLQFMSWRRKISLFDWLPRLCDSTGVRVIGKPEPDDETFVDVKTLHSQLALKANPRASLPRVLALTVCFFAPVFLLLLLSGSLESPSRGEVARSLFNITMFGSLFGVIFVVFCAWDASRLSNAYARNIAVHPSHWPDERLDIPANGPGPDIMSSLKDVESIAALTRHVNRLIYLPVLLLLASALAWHTAIDAWNWTWPLGAVFATLMAIPLMAGHTLRMSAEFARNRELRGLRERLPKYRERWSTEDMTTLKEIKVLFGSGQEGYYIEEVYGHGDTVKHVPFHQLPAVAGILQNTASSNPAPNAPDTDPDPAAGPAPFAPCRQIILTIDPTKKVVTKLRYSAPQPPTLTDAAACMALVTGFAKMQAAQATRERVYTEATDREATRRCEAIEKVIERVSSIRDGAFSPWSEDPIYRSTILPLAGYFSVQALEWVNILINK